MKAFERIGERIKSIGYSLHARTAPVQPKIHHEVPYVPQFARAEDAERIVKKELLPHNDPYWEDTGASSKEQYARWVRAACGMAATSMTLKHFKDAEVRLVELAEDALQHGVYRADDAGISAMRYREFVSWVTRYGLSAELHEHLSVSGIQLALHEGKLAIVSVNPNIRGYETAHPKQKGGHLVLVVGYDQDTKRLCIHNPSGLPTLGTQANHWISEAEFRAHYAGRGLLISPRST